MGISESKFCKALSALYESMTALKVSNVQVFKQSHLWDNIFNCHHYQVNEWRLNISLCKAHCEVNITVGRN